MDTPEWIAYQDQFDLPASYFQEIPSKTKKHCVIVEPRCHERLIPVIKNFMFLLQSKGWGLIIYHSGENEEFVKKGLEGWPNVLYHKVVERNMMVHQYNDLLCSPQFWNDMVHIGSHHVLMFQVDTVLLKDTIDDFLQYDYVGAPWSVRWLGLDIGNGGLSLRNVWKCRLIAGQCPRVVKTIYGDRHLGNEDVYFAWYMHHQGASLPTVETAKEFSIETIFHPDPCGMHQPHMDIFPSYETFSKLFDKRWIR